MNENIRKKLEALRQQKAGGTESKVNTLKNRLGANKPPINNATGATSLRNKFKKRSSNVLERTYDERNIRSKSSSVGKTLFNQELMQECGIEDFSTTIGDRFIEILPISFDPNVPYFKELSVHFGVGFAKDAFLCLNRFKSNTIRHTGRCYRCERQQVMWRDQETYTKKETTALYPLDRACYLIWERTKELVDSESPDYTFKLWAAPKTKVHSEIQEKVRDKIHRVTLDVSDLSIDGDGRTVNFTIVKQGEDRKFVDYKAFDLMVRDKPIPEEVIEKLSAIIQLSEEKGFSNCIEMFLNIPEYDDIAESMATEEDIEDTSENKPAPIVKRQLKANPSVKATPTAEDNGQGQGNVEFDDSALIEELEEIQAELEQIAGNRLLWLKWLKDNGYEQVASLPQEEAIQLIIDDMYEKEIHRLSGN